jgi:5-methylcytosine-specific restriction protein B
VHWLFYGYNQSPKFLEDDIVKSHNLILEEYIESAKKIFKKRFPSFLDFQRPGKEYLEYEYDYKKEMIEEAKKYIEELSEDNFSTNIRNILEPTTDANFFNWRDIGSFTNLTTSAEEVIYTQTKKLILSVKENRIKDDFDSIVNELSKVIKYKNVVWLYVSYILFIFDDKNHMAMKSSVIDSIMKFFGKESVARGTKITYKTYMEVIDFSNEIAALLEDWKPKDMIDMHSFFWVVANNDDVLDKEEKVEQEKKDIDMSLNTILYGPPGTGKTYYTINTALEIIDSEFYENNKNNRDALNEKFEEYKKSGQIVFITFHQSYGYEEFIEGIRANTNDDTISYSIEDGSFKLISDKALENYKNHQNYLTIGSHEKQVNIELLMNDYSNYVSEELEKGNEVLITSDAGIPNKTLLGSVNRASDGSFKSFYTSGSVNKQSLTRSIIIRDFQNFINGEIQSYQNIEPRYDSQSSYHGNAIYYFELYTALQSYFDRDEAKYTLDTDEVKLKNFVLIIDEINRGNISKIFGELITLIEPNKRLGADEIASIALPYSQKPFTVPNNLYLVGTMNTADRSIALLDTALRRRFEFIEMMPKHTLDEISVDVEDKGINLQEILRVINERIEYLYDRDHTIGHSYFMGINTLNKLDEVMKNKIIPLLQEYFYDDWEKIQIVLGDHYKQLGQSKDADSFEDEINKLRFVQSERKREKNVLGFNHEDIEDEQVGYQIRNTFKKKTYKKIYEQIDIQNA